MQSRGDALIIIVAWPGFTKSGRRGWFANRVVLVREGFVPGFVEDRPMFTTIFGIRGRAAFWGLLAACAALGSGVSGARGLEVGFGKRDITPDPGGKAAVWLAGYGMNRKAEGVHDPLYARAIVLKSGDRAIGLVSVDLVGYMYPNTLSARAKASARGLGLDYVLVGATHNHEGPDTIGIWGPNPMTSGVDPSYLERTEDLIVEALAEALGNLREAEAEYGTAEDGELLHDSRLPIVKDGVLRTIRFRAKGGGELLTALVQWNCHPENLGSKNRLVTADFPYATVSALEDSWKCPILYMTGAIGGLMSAPERKFAGADGRLLVDGEFEFAEVYGREVAKLAEKAAAGAAPIVLEPLEVRSRVVYLPLSNPNYKLARVAGILKRDAYQWTGNAYERGAALPGRSVEGTPAIETEVAYLRFGELHVASIPGEIYPELVTGEYQEPIEPNADFPDAPREVPILRQLPGEKVLILGLANDEVGYIIPKTQWDYDAPFAYGRESRQYGEVNSVGPEVAPILMRALADCVADAKSEGKAGGE